MSGLLRDYVAIWDVWNFLDIWLVSGLSGCLGIMGIVWTSGDVWGPSVDIWGAGGLFQEPLGGVGTVWALGGGGSPLEMSRGHLGTAGVVGLVLRTAGAHGDHFGTRAEPGDQQRGDSRWSTGSLRCS